MMFKVSVGSMSSKITVFSSALLALMLISCGKSGESEKAGPLAMPPMPVSVLSVQPTSVPISIEAVAQTEGAQEVEVRPRVGGIILKKLFDEGAEIKAGQAMFKLDPAPFQIALAQAKAQVTQQQARITQTERESKRLESLLAMKSISQREYDNAVSDNSMAKASLMEGSALVREAMLNLSYTTVTAPSSGLAGRFLFSEGALVAANTSLLTTIVKISPIWVRFSLSDSELISLGGRLNESSVKKLTLLLPDGSEYPEAGKLNFFASEINPTLGTQQLRASFLNAEKQLLPGQFVRIRVTTGSQDGVFLVPQAAILSGEQGKFVYVAETDSKGNTVAAIRPIKAGGWHGTDWVVLSGLKAGDQVVVDNLLKVRPGAPIQPKPAKEQSSVPEAVSALGAEAEPELVKAKSEKMATLDKVVSKRLKLSETIQASSAPSEGGEND